MTKSGVVQYEGKNKIVIEIDTEELCDAMREKGIWINSESFTAFRNEVRADILAVLNKHKIV